MNYVQAFSFNYIPPPLAHIVKVNQNIRKIDKAKLDAIYSFLNKLEEL
jgi:hypothetical protein